MHANAIAFRLACGRADQTINWVCFEILAGTFGSSEMKKMALAHHRIALELLLVNPLPVCRLWATMDL